MSAVTKVFIVLLVILALMQSAGIVVYVNRAERFNATIATQKASVQTLTSQLATARADAAAQASFAAAARTERDAEITKGQTASAGKDKQISDLQIQLADANSNLKISQVTIETTTSALNASEAARKAQSDILDTTRTSNNTITKENADLNSAVSDLTNKLEVAQRRVSDYSETIVEQKTELEAVQAKFKGIAPAMIETASITVPAPPINAVVRSVSSHNGIPYATISVGADAQVKKGMKFSVFDSTKNEFMGELTVETVDSGQSTGKLEGPHVEDVRAGTEAKTQL